MQQQAYSDDRTGVFVGRARDYLKTRSLPIRQVSLFLEVVNPTTGEDGIFTTANCADSIAGMTCAPVPRTAPRRVGEDQPLKRDLFDFKDLT